MVLGVGGSSPLTHPNGPARVAELADALDLGSSIERCGGSSPPSRTKLGMENSRYSRQERLPQIGPAGQEALAQATVAIIGLGALGCVSADLLVRSGVGQLLLIDRDVVELSNLQRQSLYDERQALANIPKALAAEERLSAINSTVAITALATDLTAANITQHLSAVDLILDGTDNFATRYLLNDYAVSAGKNFLYTGVVSTYGMLGLIQPGGPCLRCIWPEPPDAAQTPTCRSAGVLGPAVHVLSALACTEALKILCQQTQAVIPGFRYVDVWQNTLRTMKTSVDPQCPCCGQGLHPWLDGQRGTLAAQVICGGGAVQVPSICKEGSDLAALAEKLRGTVVNLQCHPSFLRFQLEGLDVLHFADGRSLVRGTEDPGRARAVLAQTLGG